MRCWKYPPFGYTPQRELAGDLQYRRDGVAVTASLLDEEGIAVRGGLHCAPGVHRCLGTLEGGAVRVSPGLMNTAADARALIDAVAKIAG